MKVLEYDAFVRRTDQNAARSSEDRLNIALYGLVGEIGSLMSAVKKQVLASDDASKWSHPTDELIEELGDIVWYCFAAVQLLFPAGNTNIFASEIAFLKRMLTSEDEKFEEFRALLSTEKINNFLGAAEDFPKGPLLEFDDFQKLAFKVARTDGAVLRQVCLAVLWQLGAELLRYKLPDSERAINKRVVDRKISYVLGDIAWHVAAVASVYGLSLNDIIARNVQKIEFRLGKGSPTPLHDDDYPAGQKFPREFAVSIISVGPGRSRQYLNGRPLGDDLTDNAYDPDGYRFHDVLHLANVAKLGWSPVLRDLLKLKRKRDPKVDEVEDGARARIVEEAVIKAIHSEGVRLARQRQDSEDGRQDLFPDGEDISFGFLKFISHLVSGLEVEKNKYWEWEEAILVGYRMFHELRVHGQGTISVDLGSRSLKFTPHVHPDYPGPVSGIGTAVCAAAQSPDERKAPPCVKAAILDALGLDGDDTNLQEQLEVTMLSETRPSVVARGAVRDRIWARSVVCFRTSLLRSADLVSCTAVAVADIR